MQITLSDQHSHLLQPPMPTAPSNQPNSARTSQECDKGFITVRHNGREGTACETISSEFLTEQVENPDALFAHPNARTIKQSASVHLVHVPFELNGQQVECGYKKVGRKTWLKKVTDLFRLQDRARHSFQMGHALLAAGIKTPRPLWVIPAVHWSWNSPAYLAIEWLSNSSDLNAHLNAHVNQLQEQLVKQDHTTFKTVCSVSVNLGKVLGQMHAAGICHRDLKFSNVLLDITQTPPRIDIIDLDGATLTSGNNARWLWNLSRLVLSALDVPCLSRTMRLRFLHSYLASNLKCNIPWKEAWSQLDQLTTKRRRKKRS